MAPEDKLIIESILSYTNTLVDAVREYNIDENVLQNNLAMRGMAAFFIQQIGECVKKLSSEFKEQYREIEWKAISGFRNRIVHAYGRIDVEILWDTIQHDIPELRAYCAKIISKN